MNISGITRTDGTETEINYTVRLFRLYDPYKVKTGTDEGTYINEVEVSFFCDFPYVNIYYTTDGSIPNIYSNRYDKPIKINESTVFHVISTINDFQQGDVSVFRFNIERASEWAVNDIKKAISLNLVPPPLQGRYLDNITRGDFCKLAMNLLTEIEGKPLQEILDDAGIKTLQNPFIDTSEPEILAANALGIVKGVGNGRFNPDGLITRQEAAVMLTRTAALLGIDSSENAPELFSDIGEFADWAEDSILFISSIVDRAGNKKVMGGVGNNRFSPHGSYTREQSIVTMLRLFNVIKNSNL